MNKGKLPSSAEFMVLFSPDDFLEEQNTSAR
jgi:hypothetical protein